MLRTVLATGEVIDGGELEPDPAGWWEALLWPVVQIMPISWARWLHDQEWVPDAIAALLLARVFDLGRGQRMRRVHRAASA